jgi:hypothetical protein
MGLDSNSNKMTVNGQSIQQSLVITAALEQVLLATVLYLLLGLAAFVISFRTPGAPFTLAGLLMMRSKLARLYRVPEKGDEKGDEKDDDLGEKINQIIDCLD